MSALITWKSQRSRPFDLVCYQLDRISVLSGLVGSLRPTICR
jgi:hypothetical protein